MKKAITIILIGCLLSGCSFFRVHKMDIEQGNVLTQEDVARLHPGMSEAQVKALMGDPVLVNLFTPNREEYVYTYKPAYGDLVEKHVTLIFQHGRLVAVGKSRNL